MRTQDDLQSLAQRSIVLLAPTACRLPDSFTNVHVDPAAHRSYLRQLQRMRGALYLEDGAISSRDLTADGLHVSAVDERSWHILTVNAAGKVSGCARYLRHDEAVSFRTLTVGHSALAQSDTWGHLLQRAIELEIEQSRTRQIGYVELGGWALAHEIRNTRAALLVGLATFGLTEQLGGALGVSMSTVRHGSAAMMRKFGGRSLEIDGVELPPYYDPLYGCQMEVLRYDSARPSARFFEMICEVAGSMSDVPVLCPTKLPVSVSIECEATVPAPLLEPIDSIRTLRIQ